MRIVLVAVSDKGVEKRTATTQDKQQSIDLLQFRYNYMSRFLNESASAYVLNSSILKEGKPKYLYKIYVCW